MHVFGDAFLDNLNGVANGAIPKDEELVFPVPMINLHPALPGEYDGANALDRAWDDYQAGKIVRTGVMVHRVVKQVDAGQSILTREIPFREGESKDEFETRLHSVEWEAIVQATKQVLEQRMQQLRGSPQES
jgi:phosphoribosylglycinamide formyltransferase